MKIYVSAAWSRKKEMYKVAQSLEASGHTCTSQWVVVDADSMADAAAVDAYDIQRCDLVLRFSDPEFFGKKHSVVPRKLISGARHTEVGMGLAWGKKIAVVGGAQNAFDYLPQVMHFATCMEFIAWLDIFGGDQ